VTANANFTGVWSAVFSRYEGNQGAAAEKNRGKKRGEKTKRKSRSLTPIRKQRDWVRDDSGGGVAKGAIGSGGSGCDALEKGPVVLG